MPKSDKHFSPVETIELRMIADTSGLAAAASALSAAREAVRRAEGQLTAMGALSFFEAHPEVASAAVEGSWESNDEGGSSFYMSCEIQMAKGFEEDDGALGEELCDWLSDYDDRFEGFKLTAKNALSKIGQELLGKAEFAAWSAEIERLQIAASTPAAEASAKEALRV